MHSRLNVYRACFLWLFFLVFTCVCVCVLCFREGESKKSRGSMCLPWRSGYSCFDSHCERHEKMWDTVKLEKCPSEQTLKTMSLNPSWWIKKLTFFTADGYQTLVVLHSPNPSLHKQPHFHSKSQWGLHVCTVYGKERIDEAATNDYFYYK